MIVFVSPETNRARRRFFIRWFSRVFHEVRGNFADVCSESQHRVAESAKLEQAIKANLRGLSYGG